MIADSDRVQFEKITLRIRRIIVEMVSRTRSPHVGSSFSCVEILVALYFKVMNISRETVSSPDRDRFILSKGHACPALYAVLAERGFIKEADLESFAVNGGIFQQHPDRNVECGIEFSTGSLGHGLSVAAGIALDAKVRKKCYRVFTLIGDGEMNEGSVWEAIIFGGHHRLNNLIAIIDNNRMQALGFTHEVANINPMKAKLEAFGWNAVDVDGHNISEIFDGFDQMSADKPNAVILHTTKGKGVSFMENELLWHYRYPQDDEYELAMKELT